MDHRSVPFLEEIVSVDMGLVIVPFPELPLSAVARR